MTTPSVAPPLPFLEGYIRVMSPTIAQIVKGTDETIQAVDSVLAYFDPKARYDPRYKRGVWDGTTYLLAPDNTFPAGLAPYVGKRCGLVVKGWPDGGLLAQLPQPIAEFAQAMPSKPLVLRPYQEEAVEAALTAQRGQVVLPTGAGKTVVISALLRRIARPTLVVVPTKELLTQTATNIHQQTGLPVWLYGGGNHGFGAITVATFQALYRDREEVAEELAAFEVVIADEAHHTSARTYNAVMQACGNAVYRYGFTATPETDKESDFAIQGSTGPICYRMQTEEAIKLGVLTPPHVLMLNLAEEGSPAFEALDPKKFWHRIHKEGIVANAARNAALAEAAAMTAAEWGATLVIVREIAQGQQILDRLRAVQTAPQAEFITAAHSDRERKRQLERLGNGALPILIATGILDEGVDVPAVSAVVLADGGKAAHKVMQRVGRGMRRGGQNALIVVDLLGGSHGVLRNHARARMRLYKREGWQVEVVRLPAPKEKTVVQ